ncbi:SPW repeat domain-containing protein [Chamaesiphon minutus]|uniref:SPW repeat-containing integral membrane domain-containing protein n=1 Tax=Chamaesiphon minutus (strain ATCC 27169 / PCC 6605) TaxID=1173020 RepID=K9UQL5_CHAP6|nr:hypothetical protein [Chamaesiphon minutus]AFY96973.1 hypothetical protein Cha6605_6141 [Chamaesiphon minutus PCC 6605]
MNGIRFVSGSLHGILDYAAAIVLITVPLALNFQTTSPFALWLSVAAGILLIAYSLITDYGLSVVKWIPFNVHLILDAVAGIAFLAVPFLFGFDGLIRWFYLANGAIVLLLVIVTDPRISRVENR